jgi:LPS sulfotransferase NodH
MTPRQTTPATLLDTPDAFARAARQASGENGVSGLQLLSPQQALTV